jgi:methylenetetrahydrofolate dehydrogenase (NADP+)/methenyltetrahydrofolate cyclohydrolase
MNKQEKKLLSGKPVAARILNFCAESIAKRLSAGLAAPGLAIVRVGANEEDLAYETRILRDCSKIGIRPVTFSLPATISAGEFIVHIQKLNQDPSVQGILVFRPLPEHLDTDEIAHSIAPEKDVDCMNPINLKKLITGDRSAVLPCTPEAVIEILKHYGHNLSGRNVVIVNRSLVLGKPLALMLLNENATPTICHSRTVDLKKITRKADIVVVGVGQACYFDGTFFAPESIVIDVGINTKEDGSMSGDLDFEDVAPVVDAVTPVPGGVGAVTTAVLLRHVVNAMEAGNFSKNSEYSCTSSCSSI